MVPTRLRSRRDYRRHAAADHSGIGKTQAAAPFQLTYRDAFLDAANLDPLTASNDALANAAGSDDALIDSIGDDRNAWLDLLFSTAVANSFDDDRLTVVTHFPAEQAALARLAEADRTVAERFEVFELTDETELRTRFERDIKTRAASGSASAPLDERFLEAIRAGLPDCAGVALGFERLHMLYANATDIRDVISFEFEA